MEPASSFPFFAWGIAAMALFAVFAMGCGDAPCTDFCWEHVAVTLDEPKSAVGAYSLEVKVDGRETECQWEFPLNEGEPDCEGLSIELAHEGEPSNMDASDGNVWTGFWVSGRMKTLEIMVTRGEDSASTTLEPNFGNASSGCGECLYAEHVISLPLQR